MVKVLVGSTNPAKVSAAKSAFSAYFKDAQVEGYNADSGVPPQPMNGDVFKGARQRAEALRGNPEAVADYYVGIEGGILDMYGRWMQADCVCIVTESGRVSFGIASSFELPAGIVEELKRGSELSKVVDGLLGISNTREMGVINHLSKGRVNKAQHLSEGVQMALLPLMNEQFFSGAIPSHKPI